MRTAQIKQLFRIIGGKPAPKGDSAYSDEGTPFIKMKDLGRAHFSNNFVDIEQRVSDVVAKKEGLNLVRRGAILLPRSGSVALNHRAVLGIDAYMVSHICALEVINQKEVNNLYAYYYLRSIKMDRISKKTTGLDAITFEDLGKLSIPLPNLDDQTRIARLLSKVDGLIAQRKQHLQQLDDLLKSVFLEMFGDPVRNEKGWETSPIEGFCEAVIDCPHSTPEYSDVETGYYCVRSSDIVEGYLDLKNTYQVSKDVFEDRITRYRPQPNDIVYSREGGRLGNAARISGGRPICLGQRMMLFKVNSSNKPEFLWALLESAPFKSKLRGLVGGGAAPRVNIKDLKKLVVVKPDADLQELFSLFVLRADQLRARYEQSLTDLEALYCSLSQKAFKGELDLSRVALPAAPIEGERPVTDAVPTPITPQVTELPETDLLLPALQDRTQLVPLLRFWLEAYRTQLGSATFSLERFIADAQTKLAERHPDNDFEWAASD